MNERMKLDKMTAKEISKAAGDYINAVIAIADENKYDRDDIIVMATETIAFISKVATFKNYEPVETSHDKHWSECRQIALYDNQIKQMQDHIDRLKGVINALCGYVGGANNG